MTFHITCHLYLTLFIKIKPSLLEFWHLTFLSLFIVSLMHLQHDLLLDNIQVHLHRQTQKGL